MNTEIRFDEHENEISFFKKGWKSVAQIDNIPEIVDIVKSNTWVDNNGYLYCSKLKKYLHRLVVEYKIGKEKLTELTENGFVVDHLNNNEKYNCHLDNLHVISADLNIAKGHTVDKDIEALCLKAGIGLYWLKNSLYQIAVGFNMPTIIRIEEESKKISHLYWNFDNFDKCYIAIQTIISALKGNCKLYVDQLQTINWYYRETIALQNVDPKKRLVKYGDTYLFRNNDMNESDFRIIDKPAKLE